MRLGSLDRTLLRVGLPLWALLFGLSLSSQLRHQGYSPIFVEGPADESGHPTVVGLRPWLAGVGSELRAGDRLLRVGAEDLRGAGPLRTFAAVARQDASSGALPVLFERGGERREALLPLASYAIFWPFLIPSLAFCATSLVLYRRARPSPMVTGFARSFGAIALVFASYVAGHPLETALAAAVNLGGWTVVLPLVLRASMLFPHDEPPGSPIARAWPWSFAVLGPLVASSRFGVPWPADLGEQWAFALLALAFAVTVLLFTRNYPRADAIGRRQLRWVLLGLYFAAIPPMVASALAALDLRWTPVANFALAATAIFPVSIAVAIARFNLFDVDRLISATATYNLMILAAVAGAVLVAPAAADLAWRTFGVATGTGRVLVALGIGLLALPAQRYVQPRVERLLFPDRWAVGAGMAGLLTELSACKTPQELTRVAGERIDALLGPETCVIYGAVPQEREVFAPVFVRGRAVPPAFEPSDPLVATLRTRALPLTLESSGAARPDAPLSPFDQAVLQTLDASVVVPARRGPELRGFLVLGRKRLGDVYTPWEIGLLAAVAEKLSLELLRFQDAEVRRAGEEMREALRRYVPGAVARELEGGREPFTGRREVSVLFVDMRGYAGLAEQRPLEDVFSTLNRYTRLVSEVVASRGGSVVEFNGDGMMAVFGAPRPLPDKERAAVAAGREILASLHAVGETISAGIGIATGEAFVGDLRGADRLIWSAIGDTTNLAARLQALAKELGAAMVVDAATWRGAKGEAGDFALRREVPIRGRQRREDVYVMRAARSEPGPPSLRAAAPPRPGSSARP
jgi:class 3 adenylate cyclase